MLVITYNQNQTSSILNELYVAELCQFSRHNWGYMDCMTSISRFVWKLDAEFSLLINSVNFSSLGTFSSKSKPDTRLIRALHSSWKFHLKSATVTLLRLCMHKHFFQESLSCLRNLASWYRCLSSARTTYSVTSSSSAQNWYFYLPLRVSMVIGASTMLEVYCQRIFSQNISLFMCICFSCNYIVF